MVPSASGFTLSAVSANGERPQALRPYSFLVFGSQTIANRSPPTPFAVGSMSPRQAFTAIAASTAEPPSRSTCSPACTASGCAAHTMPWRPYTTERVAAPRSANVVWSVTAVMSTTTAIARERGRTGAPPNERESGTCRAQ